MLLCWRAMPGAEFSPGPVSERWQVLSTIMPPATISTHPLSSQRDSDTGNLSEESPGTRPSWALRNAVFQFRSVCVHSGRSLKQYLVYSSLRQYRIFHLLHDIYFCMFLCKYWISTNMNKTVDVCLSCLLWIYDSSLKSELARLLFYLGFMKVKPGTLAKILLNCWVNLHLLENNTFNEPLLLQQNWLNWAASNLKQEGLSK